MDDIYNQLNVYLKGSSKTGINETIAEFMLMYLRDIPAMRASDIADRCHTSTPSIIRFCRDLGYQGFPDFKDAVDTYCQNVEAKVLVPNTSLRLLGSEEEFATSVENWTHLMKEYAKCAMLALDRQQVIRLAKDILQYPQVYVFGGGFSGLVAEQLRIRLARSGKIVITSTTPRTEQLPANDRSNTMAIVISQHARFLNEPLGGTGILSYLTKSCAKTWLITQEPKKRRFSADEVLYIQGSSSFEVEYHTLIYFEELLGDCCRQLLENTNKR